MNGKTLPVEILNERRRLAVKLRLSGMTVAEVARHVELSAPTVIAAHQAYLTGGWNAVRKRTLIVQGCRSRWAGWCRGGVLAPGGAPGAGRGRAEVRTKYIRGARGQRRAGSLNLPVT